MQALILNFTRILEKNPKIYWGIILGIAGCSVLFISEAVHVQNIISALNTKDQSILKQAIEPVSQSYGWARAIVIIFAVIFSNVEYIKTKKKLGLYK